MSDLVILTFAGSSVKSVRLNLTSDQCAKEGDQAYEDGYPSLVLRDASSLKVGDSAQKARELKRSQG